MAHSGLWQGFQARDTGGMETFFEIVTRVAMSGWVALAIGLFLPRMRPALILYAGRILPALIASAYVAMLGLFFSDMPPLSHEPTSIAGVRELLASDAGLSAAWFHFLAFDLVFGAWMTEDGLNRSLPRVGLITVMVTTWFAGPTGFLVYFALRGAMRRGAAA